MGTDHCRREAEEAGAKAGRDHFRGESEEVGAKTGSDYLRSIWNALPTTSVSPALLLGISAYPCLWPFVEPGGQGYGSSKSGVSSRHQALALFHSSLPSTKAPGSCWMGANGHPGLCPQSLRKEQPPLGNSSPNPACLSPCPDSTCHEEMVGLCPIIVCEDMSAFCQVWQYPL